MSKRRRKNSTNNATNNQVAPKVSLKKEQSNQQTASNGTENTVWVANGAGNQPIQVDWETGDTVGTKSPFRKAAPPPWASVAFVRWIHRSKRAKPS